MEGIDDEVLADLALDEGLDCSDLAVIQHIMQQEEERIELDRGFDLQKFFGVVGAKHLLNKCWKQFSQI